MSLPKSLRGPKWTYKPIKEGTTFPSPRQVYKEDKKSKTAFYLLKGTRQISLIKSIGKCYYPIVILKVPLPFRPNLTIRRALGLEPSRPPLVESSLTGLGRRPAQTPPNLTKAKVLTGALREFQSTRGIPDPLRVRT